MTAYKNLSGDSGVKAFEINGNMIAVKFTNDAIYLYDSHRPGLKHVHQMLKLALEGKGLSTYISRFVRDDFARRLE